MEIDRAGQPRLYEGDPGLRHLRARLTLDDGTEVWFSDVRRFGTGILVDDADLPAYFAQRVGIEPLSDELTAEAIAQIAAGRIVPFKSFLLNQKGIAGIERILRGRGSASRRAASAFTGGFDPAGARRGPARRDRRNAGTGAGERRFVNRRLVNAEGEKGSMQEEFLVHTREGQDCPRCGESIRRIVIGGRSSYFCPACQRRLRRRPRRAARCAPAGGKAMIEPPAGFRDRSLDGRRRPHRLHGRARPTGLSRWRRRARGRAGHAPRPM